MKKMMIVTAAGLMLVGCEPWKAPRVEALDAKAWEASEWISVASAPAAGEAEKKHQRAADGTSVFRYRHVNAKEVKSAKWMTAGLGVYQLYLNGGFPLGKDFLKPGFTHGLKTKRSFTYDITAPLKKGKGETNDFGVEVSAGWWRDQIVQYVGKKSAFRGVIEFTYVDGTTELVGTKASEWYGCIAGPVKHAGIFDGEEYDAREWANCARRPQGEFAPGGCERNDEFKGEILPTDGAEICLRCDLAKSCEMIRKDLIVKPGEPLVVDFGQNCAAVPFFSFRATRGIVLTALPGEMLNDADKGQRGCDGPKGSVYRANLRIPDDGMRIVYTFAGEGWEEYCPTFTFFGYRYLSITATDEVEIRCVASVPVTSITKEMELGKIETGDKDVNRLIANVYWGQLSNYLSVPTDCPQRNERLGWTADTQVFTEAGTFNADTSRFFHKWMRDLVDTQHEKGGFTGVAPLAQYGCDAMRLGWSDAGIIVPYQIWKQFGDLEIVRTNWAAMEKYLARMAETKYDYEATKGDNGGYQWADWLSYEALESCGGGAFESVDGKRVPKADAKVYWSYLGACYWMWDAQMMAQMAKAVGKDAAKYERMTTEAKSYLKAKFFSKDDGMILPAFRAMQTPAVFALKLGLVEGAAKEKTIAALKKNFADHGDCLQTGFLGTSILMDTLTENGMADIAYTLLLQHKNPSWLYSVDQGATTIWERWNSYTKKDGFGPVGMNSFNHYAYGCVLSWMYGTMAGIQPGPKGGFDGEFRLAPVPDARMGFVEATYKTKNGVIRSAWKYENGRCRWRFTVPDGSRATVVVKGVEKVYGAGEHAVEL